MHTGSFFSNLLGYTRDKVLPLSLPSGVILPSKILVSRLSIKQMLDLYEEYPGVENGGRLLGEFCNESILVHAVLPPGPDTIRTPVELHQNGVWQDWIFSILCQRFPRLSIVGSYHHHLCNGCSSFSSGDIATYTGWLKRSRIDKPFLGALLYSPYAKRKNSVRIVKRNMRWELFSRHHARGIPMDVELNSSVLDTERELYRWINGLAAYRLPWYYAGKTSKLVQIREAVAVDGNFNAARHRVENLILSSQKGYFILRADHPDMICSFWDRQNIDPDEDGEWLPVCDFAHLAREWKAKAASRCQVDSEIAEDRGASCRQSSPFSLKEIEHG